LIWHDGPVMGTQETGRLVITPIFWNPAGHPMASRYKDLITTYIGDVAAASGSTGTVYANLPFPIYLSPVGFTCGTNVNFPGVVETPNGNPGGDTVINPTSHEVSESITDPDTMTGWFDSSGFEVGDECNFIYGRPQGAPGQFFNQVINGHHYLTQEEFSNSSFAASGSGCLQSP
jgi:hypothetical protein